MSQTALTPFRKTHLRFDIPFPVVTEFPFGTSRAGEEIARGGAQATGSAGVHQLTTGAWALEPIQESVSNIHERTDTLNAVVPKTGFTLAPYIAEKPLFRQSLELTGVTYDPSVAATGDLFLVKEIPAGQSWQQSLDSDISTYGQPTLPTANVPMDRIGVGNVTYPAEQPFIIRFSVPGTKLHSPDWIKTFYFGGPASADGGGQYALSLNGTGLAMLTEQINGEWKGRDLWTFTNPQHIGDGAYIIRIWPHRRPNGAQFIEFRASTTSSAPTVSSGLMQSVYGSPTAPNVHIYTVAQRPPALPRPSVTGPGPIRFDHRRDLRVRSQFSLLRFAATGTLIDWPFQIPFGVTTPLTLSWSAIVPDGCALVGRVFDATTGAELTPVSAGPTFAVYAPNPNQPNYYAQFDFASDPAQTTTPLLWSYAVQKDGVIEENAPGETEAELWPVGSLANSVLESLSISGPERDPSHETANLNVEDYTGRLLVLNNRASIIGQIETEYDPQDPDLRSVQHTGYAERVTATKKGMPQARQGMGGGGQFGAYPSSEWRHYEIAFLGVWKRLMEMRTFFRQPLAPDPATGDAGLPYKVTDVIRTLIGWAGFPPSMIDVPDLDIRFFPSPGGDGKELTIEPGASIGELILQWCRDYLFYFLAWDANAGTQGMFRLRPPALPPYTNLATFTTSMPPGTLAHRPEGYGTPNWVGLNPVAFVKKGTLQTYVKAPEANAVFVCGGGDTLNNQVGQLLVSNYLINFDSLNNPASPDYLGRLVPLIIVDPSLGTQEAVDWFTRAYYLRTCFAIKIAAFEAPNVLVIDPNDALQTKPRSLRYYDPVLSLNDGALGQYLVRDCNPFHKKDEFQWARFELESPRI